MIILGLDTTGGFCTAALINEGAVIASASENIGRGHAERLAPMVQEMLTEADLSSINIDRLSVCTGPGSFTGLRVALAFAKGFALPRRIPVIGLSALEVLAAQADPKMEKKVVSIMDVRRGQLCWAVFEQGEQLFAPKTQSQAEAIAEINALGFDVLAGDGAHYIGDPSSHVVVLGPALAQLSEHKDPKNYPAAPLYSRGPDAKLPGGIDP